jgi:SNF2 family DNA or RNA helicase
MTIDFNENILTISNASLSSKQVYQLKFWGFESVGLNAFEFSGDQAEKRLKQAIAYFQKEKLKFKPTKSGETKINSIAERTAEFQETKKLGQDFKNGVYSKKQFKEFEQFCKTHLPKRKLKPHQLKAAFHLYLIHNGANFSVPGSGKTSVVLSVYEKLREEGKANVLFVVGPPACFGPWKNEFEETLGRKPKVKVLAGGDKKSRKSEYFANSDNKLELYLTTFQTLINDQKEINTFFSQKGINVFLVIDEAHYIKQVNGNWASAVLNIAKHSKFRCILTGTPIPKSFSDIYNLFDFLWPKNETIESSVRIKLQTFEKSNMIPEAKSMLENRIGPLFYRVRKKDLGLTEQIFHEPIVLPMNNYEKTIYEAIERNIRHYPMDAYLENIDFVNKLKRGRMIRLRQCTSYSHLLSKAVDNYDENILQSDKNLQRMVKDYDSLELPAKFEYLTKKVAELQKHKQKVVIWTNFVGTIEKLEKHFNKKLGMYCRSIYGKTPIEQSTIADEKTREEIRDEFVNPKSGLDILIANPAACAESISLHKTCHNAIYYDLTYNCAQYLQSLDRIHRVGGSEEIEANYFFLQYENSIDQDILNNLRRKADRMSKIIDEDYRIYSLDMFDDEDEEINAYNRLFGKK